jgi:glycosyltransferase involved in cell wall biosynthesis
MNLDYKISLVITTYERFDTFLDSSLEKYVLNPYIYEIVISDDCSTDYEKLIDKYGSYDKVKIYKNDSRLGCFYNKLKACKYATGSWICLMDSDNFCDLDYFEAIFRYWSTNTYSTDIVYCPEKALPDFIYSSLLGIPINKENWNQHYKSSPGGCFLNTCNNIFHVSILHMQDNPEINPHGYDSLYIAYKFIKNGMTYVCVPGMSYQHRVHDGSNWRLEIEISTEFIESFDFNL